MDTNPVVPITKNFLTHINAAYPDHPNRVIQNPSERLGVDEWQKAGRPHEWENVETKDVCGKTYRVWLDYGHGKIALTKEGVLIKHGKDFLSDEDVVVLEKEYYGTKKYIWS
jgi:hypothetical protein